MLPISNGLGFMMSLRFGGKGSLTDLIKNIGACRTALTPGLLKNSTQKKPLSVYFFSYIVIEIFIYGLISKDIFMLKFFRFA